MSPILLGKCAVVTGGSRGIGLAIAQEFITQGAKVLICCRNATELKKALKNLNENEQAAFGLICDVSKFSDCQKLIKFAKRKLKKIDILVNNAGIYGPIGPFEKMDMQMWQKALEINFMGTVYCSHLVIPEMLKNGKGKIINLCGAGVGGSRTMPRFTSYFTSKFAIAGFSEVLADELEGKNIQVNSISPGAVNTFLNEYLLKAGPNKSGKRMYDQALKQKKDGGTSPKLAAQLVAYLASDEADKISGRLLSAKWSPPEKLRKVKRWTQNLLKLRRIDQEFFYEK